MLIRIATLLLSTTLVAGSASAFGVRASSASAYGVDNGAAPSSSQLATSIALEIDPTALQSQPASIAADCETRRRDFRLRNSVSPSARKRAVERCLDAHEDSEIANQ